MLNSIYMGLSDIWGMQAKIQMKKCQEGLEQQPTAPKAEA